MEKVIDRFSELYHWVGFKELDAEKKRAWDKEYSRIGDVYSKWAAWLVIFGAPLIMFSEREMLTNSTVLWVSFRLFSSVVTAIALVAFFALMGRVRFRHEFLFLAMAYSLYINSGFWADCDTGIRTFLLGQLCILAPTALITILRPFLYLINFIVHVAAVLLIYQWTCGKSFLLLGGSFEFFIFLILAMATYLFASYRYFLLRNNFVTSTLLQEALEDVEKKRQKSDELLLNILPAAVAEELKENGACAPKKYEETTILFIDFVNFTVVSEQLSPHELVDTIHKNFTVFDRIMDKYNIEKIKTIGDAYLSVAGLPTKNDRHAQVAVQAAIEIRKYMESYGGVFQTRIGIHTGTVVAGIVGIKKFAFDIWGDAVNIAARLEQECEPGRINISRSTFEIVKDEFPCDYRGKIPAKNKGHIDMYYVV